jgi:NAD(P)H dehydrogenase (quinone)
MQASQQSQRVKVGVLPASNRVGIAAIKYLKNYTQVVPIAIVHEEDEKTRCIASNFTGVEIRKGFNFLQPDTMMSQLHEIDRLLFIPPSGFENRLTVSIHCLDSCKKAGVKHVVLVSWLDVSQGKRTSQVAQEFQSLEQHLMNLNIGYTIIRSDLFFQNLYDESPFIKREKMLKLPLGDGKCSFIDVDDVGHVAAHYLAQSSDALKNETIELTGPDLLTGKEQAQELSRQLSEQIGYESISDEEYLRRQKMIGTSDVEARARLSAFQNRREGYGVTVSPKTQEIVTKSATFQQSARNMESYYKEVRA